VAVKRGTASVLGGVRIGVRGNIRCRYCSGDEALPCEGRDRSDASTESFRYKTKVRMTIVLDAGALIAVDRGNPEMVALLKREVLAGRVPRTHGAVLGQAWRGSARQANLARVLAAIEIIPVDADLGRRAGALLARARTSDVVDAVLVLIASDGMKYSRLTKKTLECFANPLGCQLT
jgi:predicted nucleic acid-binding protein